MKKYFNTKTVIVAIAGAIIGIGVWMWKLTQRD